MLLQSGRVPSSPRLVRCFLRMCDMCAQPKERILLHLQCIYFVNFLRDVRGAAGWGWCGHGDCVPCCVLASSVDRPTP